MSAIAFIGLGQMGAPMASRLLAKGHSLTVYDINRAAMEKLAKEGAKKASQPSQAANEAEFVITMLPDGAIVREVLFGVHGVTETLKKSALVIDMSTIHPLESEKLHYDMTQAGFSYMDAPVGKTSDHAVTGTLTILAGGTDQQIARAEDVLLCMGSEMIRCGGTGNGIKVKIVNNFMSIALNALSAEAAVLCEAMALPLDKAIQVMSGTVAGKGHFTTSWPGKVLAGDLSAAFMIDLAHKDLNIALNVAGQLNVPVPLGAAAREVYSQARACGRGKQDWSALLTHVRTLCGLRQTVE
ncbi:MULTISPECIES: sulfolactaldehyde 3-reductase [Tenebrionibacter/Tenebrionicola group]|uniref:Sulfolactaldehyde 3-reductase n=2 Tax=Tenebrionibacter/Tenebrionicola group TaxID=2969848 RepID=A0A8K0V2Z8_9ENTR|nr:MULTISPECIES: sulfolactaldehyde 3-reductase [Tenebrionibacter/Tenebrionicola group]MBK4714463.1 sulfolactaldehyde 3-reductase [Tenebrionibacter intestinalis]MBV5095312.1 sulfolactaldehyde 3-reductase [Tenebrionicola larvae]